VYGHTLKRKENMMKVYFIEKYDVNGWNIEEDLLKEIGFFNSYTQGESFLHRTGADPTYRVTQYVRTQEKDLVLRKVKV